MKPEPGVNIKPEPASGPSGIPPSVPAYTVPRGPGAERAIQNIENQFGSRAATSINTIRSGLGQSTAPGPQGSQVHIPNPQAQYQQQRMAPQQQQQRTQPQPNSLAASQMDGAVDDDASPLEAVVLRRSPEGNTVELGRLEIDSLIRAQIEANARRMEGGGLMLPLKRTSKIKASRGSAPAGLRGQVDGPGDDDLKSEDADLDAINSDLDDPEDNKDSSDEDDDGLGHIMLCMYDKVQRVKNKW